MPDSNARRARRPALVLFWCLYAVEVACAQCQPIVLPSGTPAVGSTLTTLATTRNGDLVAGGIGPGGAVARWDGTTWTGYAGYDASLAPGCIVELANGDLVVGGFPFGPGASALQRYDGTSWTPMTTSWATVNSLLELPNGNLLAAGIAGVQVWNGSSWSPLGGGGPWTVMHLVRLPNGDLVAGGNFTAVGGTPANNIARWDGIAWQALGAGLDGPVQRIEVTRSGDLIAGGSFTMAGAVPVNRIARWDGSSWHALGLGLGAGTWMAGIRELPDGDIVVAGDFTQAGGIAAARIARWDGSTWHPFTTGASNGISAMAWLPRGVLAVGGTFTVFDGAVAPTFAAVGTTCPPATAPLIGGCPSSGGANTLTAVTMPWADGWFRAEATGLPALSLAMAVTSFTRLTLPIPLGVFFPSPLGCNIYVAPDILGLLLPTGGSVSSELFLPNTPPLVGLTFHHQLVVFEVDALGGFVEVTSTNGLSLTVGAF